METRIGQSQASRHRLPHSAPQRPRPQMDQANEAEQLRRLYGDRMQIQKTRAIAQPQWGMLAGVLFLTVASLGLGIGLGGGLVAIGIGIGWFSIAMGAMVWRDLELVYHMHRKSR